MNNAARGQTPVGLDKDSLRKVLNTYPSDTAKVATLIALGQQYENTQPDTAIVCYQQAGQLSQRLHLTRYDSLSQALLDRAMTRNIQQLKQALRQRGRVAILVMGILLLAALFIGNLSYYRQRLLLRLRVKEAQQAAQENLRLKAELEGHASERRWIAQEMQDEMGSKLESLLVLSEALGQEARTAGDAGDPGGVSTESPVADPGDLSGSLKESPVGDAGTIGKMQQTAEQLIRKTNEIVWTLSHEEDNLEGLITYIRSSAAQLLEQANIDARFAIDDTIPKMGLTPAFRRNVYLVVREAVNNIVRHSGASRAEINIHVGTGELTIVVQDNGRGIYKAGGSHLGNGIKNMQRWVEEVGGRMEIVAGAGTAISIAAPLSYL